MTVGRETRKQVEQMSRTRPILFNTEMVWAILDDRKTVTRRICKVPKCYPMFYELHDNSDGVLTGTKGRLFAGFYNEEHVFYIDGKKHIDAFYYQAPCKPGDILYVRETWAFWPCIECMAEGMCNKSPTTYKDREAATEGCYIYCADDHPHPERITWRPSIHMPKAAARIWLKVTDVQPQRLQKMTLDDFLKEGVVIRPEAFNDPENAYLQAQSAFIDIWDSTIPKGQQDIYSWASNPWVWAIEFEWCEKPEVENA